MYERESYEPSRPSNATILFGHSKSCLTMAFGVTLATGRLGSRPGRLQRHTK